MAFRCYDEQELEALAQVVERQQMWRGSVPEEGSFVARFEDAFAEYTGRRYVLAISSGTSANEAALVGAGVEPGDEVICPACSFIASSLTAVAVGAIPVFADVDPRTLHLTAEGLEAALTPRAKAVVVVHLWGMPADLDSILEVANRHDLAVIEDCAQAYGVQYDGRMVGTFGDTACYSLQQSKHISSGEGGIVTTDDADSYLRTALYSNCGMPAYCLRYGVVGPSAEPVGGVPTRGHFAFGHNYRMTELQGAVNLVQLGKIEQFNARRRELVQIIERGLDGAPGLRLAPQSPKGQPNFWVYPFTLDPQQTDMTASEFAARCREEAGLGPGVYNEVNYLEAVYQQMNRERRTSLGCSLPDYVRYDPGICPQAESGALSLLCLGVHHGLDPDELRATVASIAQTARKCFS